MSLSKFFRNKIENISKTILDISNSDIESNIDDIVPILQNINNTFDNLTEQLDKLSNAIKNDKIKELKNETINNNKDLLKNVVLSYYIRKFLN